MKYFNETFKYSVFRGVEYLSGLAKLTKIYPTTYYSKTAQPYHAVLLETNKRVSYCGRFYSSSTENLVIGESYFTIFTNINQDGENNKTPRKTEDTVMTNEMENRSPFIISDKVESSENGYYETCNACDNDYYNDNLDMDQQSPEFWDSF